MSVFDQSVMVSLANVHLKFQSVRKVLLNLVPGSFVQNASLVSEFIKKLLIPWKSSCGGNQITNLVS